LKRFPEGIDAAGAWERKAALLIKLNDLDGAAKAYNTSMSLGKAAKDYLNRSAGEVLLALDRFGDAQQHFEKALDIAGNFKDSAQAMGGILPCLIMQKKKDAYFKLFKTYKDKFGDENELFARIIFYEGRHYMETKNESKAKKRFGTLADQYENTSWAGEGFFYLGSIEFRKGNYEAATRHFNEYVKKAPRGRSIVMVRFKLASAYFQLQKYQGASENYMKVIGMKDATPLLKMKSTYNAAASFEKLDKWNQAADLYQQIEEKYPNAMDRGSLLVSSGFCWFKGGKFAKALALFEEALSIDSNPRMAEAHFWYAKSLDKLEKVNDAVSEFMKVNYLYREDPMWGLTALFEVGQIYERSGVIDKARKMYEKIVEQDGTHGSLGSRALKYLKKMEERYRR
jgi:tetratricopeptide (TPR) repeat protein